MKLFFCHECSQTKPETELARILGYRNSAKVCKGCDERGAAVADGTLKHGEHLDASYRRRKIKAATKTYKSGKLPKWMFS